MLNLNPFKTDFFGWIDFGIYNVCVDDLHYLDRYKDDHSAIFIQDINRRRIKILELRSVLKEEVENIYTYCSLFRWKIAGGLWTGHSYYVKMFKIPTC